MGGGGGHGGARGARAAAAARVHVVVDIALAGGTSLPWPAANRRVTFVRLTGRRSSPMTTALSCRRPACPTVAAMSPTVTSRGAHHLRLEGGVGGYALTNGSQRHPRRQGIIGSRKI